MVRLGGRRRSGASVLYFARQRMKAIHTTEASAAIPAGRDNARRKGLVLHHHVDTRLASFQLVTAHCLSGKVVTYLDAVRQQHADAIMANIRVVYGQQAPRAMVGLGGGLAALGPGKELGPGRHGVARQRRSWAGVGVRG